MANFIVNLVCKLFCNMVLNFKYKFYNSHSITTLHAVINVYSYMYKPDPTKFLFYHKCCNMIALSEPKETLY